MGSVVGMAGRLLLSHALSAHLARLLSAPPLFFLLVFILFTRESLSLPLWAKPICGISGKSHVDPT